MPRILFTTAFKPFGRDDHLGRRDSFVEVYYNRLTREDGIFSYRGHFSAFGLHAMANNLPAESVVLEYPTLARFRRELKKGYDFVGIGSMAANLQKVKLMAEMVREVSPRTKIVIGGYCAHIDHLSRLLPVDYLCTGEGISFMRELLGASPEFEFKNPEVYSRAHSFMGAPLFGRKNPHIIVGLGCPNGCEFCSPSHHFGRRYLRFFRSGAELFQEMERMEKRYRSRTFGFIGDDNFLMDQKRAEELRECVVKSGRQYEIFYFTSADKAKEFGPARMAEMGTHLVWLGRESCLRSFDKLEGIDFKALVRDLQRHGIKVIISSMFFMEHHTPENIGIDIDDHIATRSDFSMLCIYSAMPGTPLYDRMREEGRISPLPHEDWHGIGPQNIINDHFRPQEVVRIRQEIMRREHKELGPGVLRLIQTDLEAHAFLRDADSEALRRRAKQIKAKMPAYRAVLWAMARLTPGGRQREMIEDTLSRLEREAGAATAWEKTQGAALVAFALKEKLSQRVFGDIIDTPTMLTRYRGQ